MVIHDLNVVGISVAPDKTDAPLIVDADAVLSLSVSVKSFETIARRGCQVAQFRGNIQLAEFPLRHSLDAAKPLDPLPGMKPFRLL